MAGNKTATAAIKTDNLIIRNFQSVYTPRPMA
jgi:hypothetical protein